MFKFLEDVSLPDFFYENIIVFFTLLFSWILFFIILIKVLRFIFKKVSTVEKIKNYKNNIIYLQKVLLIITKLLLWIGVLAIIGIGIYNIIDGVDIYHYLMTLIAKIPSGFWVDLAINFVKIVVLIIFAKYLLKYSNIYLEKGKDKLLKYKDITKNDESIQIVFGHINRLVKYGVILSLISVATVLLTDNLFLRDNTVLVLTLFITITMGLLVVSIFNATVETLDAISEKYAVKKGVGDYYSELHYLVPVFKRTIEYIVYTIVASIVISQIESLTTLGAYVFAVVKAIGTIFIVRVLVAIFNLFIDRNYLNETIESAKLQRNKTIFPIVKSVVAAIIYFITIVLILNFFGFNPLPLLAGAGILSMVLGFGAQQVINDILSGFLIIMEDNYKVGDIVEVDNLSCVIEEISLRTTKVRAEDGRIIIFRNGNIKSIVNYSYKYANAMVDIGIDKDSDLNKVYKVLNKLAVELKAQNEDILEPMRISGVEDFSGPEIIIRTITKFKPGKYLEGERFIREAILVKFRKKGIKIPFEVREGLGK